MDTTGDRWKYFLAPQIGEYREHAEMGEQLTNNAPFVIFNKFINTWFLAHFFPIHLQ
ncbi:MAG: hypothetical protein ABIS01_05095 [Ferruginibacter sp.]